MTEVHPLQRYRRDGVVPYISREIGRPALLSLVAPRPLTLELDEKDAGTVREIYALYGAESGLRITEHESSNV